MNAYEYQKLAERTECNQHKAKQRLEDVSLVRLNHAIVGMAGEVGELAGLVQKIVYYGQVKDEKALFLELGDVLWYVAEACNALGFNMEEIMQVNIEKLKKRYPDSFTEQLAQERHDVSSNEDGLDIALRETRLTCAKCLLHLPACSYSHSPRYCDDCYCPKNEEGHSWVFIQRVTGSSDICEHCEKIVSF